MRIWHRLFGVVFAAMGTAGGQPVLADQIYDGMTFAQFKAIVTTMNLQATEKVTAKGNGYFDVTVPGTEISFLATMASCDNDVNANANQCDGFSFIHPTASEMSASAMTAFNRDMKFVVAKVLGSGRTGIMGQFYARGVTDNYVRNAAAVYTSQLAAHLDNSSVTSMNGQSPPPAYLFASPMSASTFFAQLAKKGNGKTAGAVPRNDVLDAAIVDSLHAR
jgi:hypothetical protein